MTKSIHDYTEQEALNSGLDAYVFGAASREGVRAIHSNVTRSFKCTFDGGTRVILAFAAGLTYPYRIKSVSTAAGSAISSTSNLVLAIK